MVSFLRYRYALHNVAEEIRNSYKNVDNLTATVKKIFLKASHCIEILKENYPYLPLPPKPVITKWGSWLDATIYYVDNYHKIKDVISLLPGDAKAIKSTKNNC